MFRYWTGFMTFSGTFTTGVMTIRLVLMDGTILNDCSAGYSEGRLWLTIVGLTLAEVALIAFNPDKTGRIQYDYGEMRDVYEGFTNCVHLDVDVDGKVSVCMTKGVTE